MAHTPARQLFRALGCAAAIALPPLLASSVAIPAQAQISVNIGFDDFHSRLAPYGTWSNHPRWGNVWHPTRVGSDFRPYYDGHWVNTREYGWMWVSDESWGDVPYHYGRWVRDPREGWLWVPGYVWGPSWVVWRSGGGNVGWFPMPPGDDYYGEGAYRDNFDNEYGYRDWYGPSFDNSQFLSLWIFVGENHFGDRNYRNYAVPQRDYGRFIGQTRDATNYTTINNYVVNRSVDANRLRQVTSQRFEPVPARSVIRNIALVTPATTGRQVEQRERQQRPIPASPVIRGRGAAAAGASQPAPQPVRNAPAISTPTAIQSPQRPQGRGNDRNPAALGTGQPSPQAERGAPAASAPNVRQAPQGTRGRGYDRNPAAAVMSQPSPQPERNGPAASAPTVRQVPQSAQGRGNVRSPSAMDAGPAAPQAPRVAPAAAMTQPTPSAPPTPANSPENRGGRANPQRDRGAQAPQPRVAPEQSGRGAAPGAQAPARVQGNTPAGQGNARANKQDDTKNTNNQKAAGDRKKPGGGRDQN